VTKLLQEAYDRLTSLDDSDQDAIARIILDELEDDRKWQSAFERSSSALSRLGAEAVAEHRAGLTQVLNP